MITRNKSNPLISPKDILPSDERFIVKGVFNPGAIEYNGEIILLLRVSETHRDEPEYISVPLYNFKSGIAELGFLRVQKSDPEVTFKDTRGIFYKEKDYLTSFSHLRLARSKDGNNFTVDKKPFFLPSDSYEEFGMEDARITLIEGTYYINYTGVSADGYVTRVRKTTDFLSSELTGTSFCPLNKDVVFFPEKINDKYCALHRPHNQGFGKPSIWYAESPDMVHWGNHKCVLRPEKTEFETYKVGGGATPIKTSRGWLIVYHSKGAGEKYYLNSCLVELNNPTNVISRGKTPFMSPEFEYEKSGFFDNVIFSNGHIVKHDKLMYYYGACDETTCLATAPIEYLIDHALNRTPIK